MKIKLIIVVLLSPGILFIAGPVLANKEPLETPIEEPLIPGRIEKTGTHFEIKDSEYLNIALESTEEIKVVLESIPKTISFNLETSSLSSSTVLTFSNLEPDTTYYKFEDSYKNKAVFVSG